MKPRFVTAGFDIRVWPPARSATTDATEWPQREDLYKQALGLAPENSLQLLEPPNEQAFEELVRLAHNERDGATLISIDLLLSTLASVFPSLTPPSIRADRVQWQTLGVDVCDLNGFFSALNMKVESAELMPLFDESELLNAFMLAESANVKIPAHRPFVLARIRRVINS